MKFFSTYEFNGQHKFFSDEVIDVLLGYSSRELVNKFAYDYYHIDDIKRISKSHIYIFKNCKITSSTYRMRHKNGKYIWVRSYSQNTGKDIISITYKLNKLEIFLFKIKRIFMDN